MQNLLQNKTDIELKSKFGVLLSIEQKNVLNTLNIPNYEKAIILARESKKIINCEDIEVNSTISRMIHIIHANINREIPSGIIEIEGIAPMNQIKYDISEIASFLFFECKHLTLLEIELIFRNGVTGMYGQVFGLNTVAYISWINGYKQSQERLNAIAKLAELQIKKEQPKKEMSKNETYELWITTVCDCYYNFCKGNTNTIFYSKIYDFLDKCKLIEYSTEEKKEAYAKAKISVENGLKSKVHKGEIRFSELSKKQIQYDLPRNDEIISESKTSLILEFFNQNKEFDIDIKELFTTEIEINYVQY